MIVPDDFKTYVTTVSLISRDVKLIEGKDFEVIWGLDIVSNTKGIESIEIKIFSIKGIINYCPKSEPNIMLTEKVDTTLIPTYTIDNKMSLDDNRYKVTPSINPFLLVIDKDKGVITVFN